MLINIASLGLFMLYYLFGKRDRRKMKSKIWEQIRSYFIVTVGCLIMGFSFNCFYAPVHFSIGGFSGIAQVINYFVPQVSIGTFSILLNLPLYALAWKKLGSKYLVKSLFTTVVVSLSIDLWGEIYDFKAMDKILACVYGGVLLGIGLGLILREGTSSGGSDLLAVLIRPYVGGLSIGNICLVIDIAVIIAYSSVFKGLDLAMYSGVALYIQTAVIDLVVYGQNTARLTYIISSKSDEVAQKILDMNMGVTKIEAKGAYSGTSKPVLLCAVRKREMLGLKKMIKEMDPHAFFIMCDANEVLGEGFGAYTDNPL